MEPYEEIDQNLEDLTMAEPEPEEPEWPPRPTKKEINQAEKYIKACCKASAEYVKERIPDWCLFYDLTYNKRPLSEWNSSRTGRRNLTVYTNRKMLSANPETPDHQAWHADLGVSAGPLVENFAMQLHESIFYHNDFIRIIARSGNEGNVQDPAFPTAEKIQCKLKDGLVDIQFITRMLEFLNMGPMLGTGLGKVHWVERQVMGETIFQAPEFYTLEPGLFLPDPDAQTSNCQLWNFVGDRSYVPYDQIKGRFGTKTFPGPYHLNKQEFLDSWETGESLDQRSEETKVAYQDYADNTTTSDDELKYLQVWEWHGRIWFDGDERETECVATIISGVGDEDPTSGVLVRLQKYPALNVGLRPYLVWHFIPDKGPFGRGIVELNVDVLYYMSHMLCQFIDSVRITTNPMLLMDEASKLASGIEDGQNVFVTEPGKILIGDPNKVTPFAIGPVDLNGIIALVQHLEKILEKRTGVSDASRGLSQTRKTASEAISLLRQSQRPVNTHLKNLLSQVLNPLGQMFLSFFQQNYLGDDVIFITDKGGQTRPVLLTEDEVRTGKYHAHWPLNFDDEAAVARAQALLQFFPIMQQEELPLLLNEQTIYSRKGLLEELIKLLKLNEVANVLERGDEAEVQKRISILAPGLAGPPPAQPSGPPSGPPGPSNVSPENQPNPTIPGGAGGGPMGGGMLDDLNALMAMAQNNGAQQGQMPPGFPAG